jgi:hypothetical protein
MAEKIQWRGLLTSVQPRIRLTRSFDERSHTYLGYALRVYGIVGGENREFLVGVGKGTHAKQQFRVGCDVSGECLPVADPRLENVEFYKVSKLEVRDPPAERAPEPPPWLGVPPELPVYRRRGHRRLDARTYSGRCSSCIWGCRMAVEMIVDQWKPQERRYRHETFCYGPRSCRLYKAGPTRKVPGRKGMMWEEEDWVDEDATSHRGPDE